MARHPNARRTRQNDEPDDVFVARLLQLTAWARKHSRLLAVAGALLVVLIAGALQYRDIRLAAHERAEAELANIRQTAMTGNVALAIQDLETFLVTSGTTRAADEARILLARFYLEEGRYDEAGDAVAELARKPGQPLGASAAFLLAAAQEASGALDDAETTYLRIANNAALSFERREALDFAARIRLDRGDISRAVELYERLVGMVDAESPERAVYELRLAEAKAKARS